MHTLTEHRIRARYSRNALAKKLGVVPSMIFAVEHGKIPLPARLVDPITEALGAPRDDIARYLAGEVRLVGLSPSERARVISLVDELKAGRAA